MTCAVCGSDRTSRSMALRQRVTGTAGPPRARKLSVLDTRGHGTDIARRGGSTDLN